MNGGALDWLTRPRTPPAPDGVRALALPAPQRKRQQMVVREQKAMKPGPQRKRKK